MKRGSVRLAVAVAVCALVLEFSVAAVGQTEKVLHWFGGGSDGANPYGNLVVLRGTLYGATQLGGANGYGTVFALNSRTGDERVIYSFCAQPNCVDGKFPAAGAIDVNGTLYGTTYYGGSKGDGVVFAIDARTGAESVLYTFCGRRNCTDGANPAAGLVNVNGILYGTTNSGGTNCTGAGGCGVAFAIDPKTGTETVLHSFGNGTDAIFADASLIDVEGVLFGTSLGGGAYGVGTVYELDPNTGAETVLYSFCTQTDCPDGESPNASLIAANGTLYGTTEFGGAYGDGTVFALDPGTLAETVVHSFGNGADGFDPDASLISAKGTLYGTTVTGGSNNMGSVFAIRIRTGAESVLYSFCSKSHCTDGSGPSAGLLEVEGTLYGLTGTGGKVNGGTLFSLTR